MIMPVQKFSSLLEIGKRKKLQPGTSEFSNAVRSVFWMAARLAPSRTPPPGVYKFRDMEQAQAQKKAWLRQ
jgi:hypothetical protein